ncbi:cyclin-dependent kinase inhibitor 1-like isoform X2 [Hemicordylus capensis]|uniref:cyclin-dependent kinase inhibitor 1-like isoform X2 n=1 Tax=Hemicordylus capensis TaxID=884348 RepID=UPI002302FC38|nr:cyclin-dependent kinase inhibitor 1-like isoform X2 [Hemicordylus capensis]
MESLLRSLIYERQTGVRMELRSTKANHVRRNLFGPVDHDHLQQDFQYILCASMERAKQRWNFDFLQELPAEGLLQWEELQDHEVPAFYHTCVVGEVRKPLQPMNRAIAKDAKAHHISKVKLMEKPRPAKKMPRKKNLKGEKRRQMSLTDYYTAKKQIKTDMKTPVKRLTF